jgi:hypothetical protein
LLFWANVVLDEFLIGIALRWQPLVSPCLRALLVRLVHICCLCIAICCSHAAFLGVRRLAHVIVIYKLILRFSGYEAYAKICL